MLLIKSDRRSLTEKAISSMACPVWDGHLRAWSGAGMVWVPGAGEKPNYLSK
jgi:hypothetical protein